MTPRPARKRIWRKRITRALLCLLLGAVTTVGVAWLALMALPRSPLRGSVEHPPVLTPSHEWTFEADSRAGVHIAWISVTQRDSEEGPTAATPESMPGAAWAVLPEATEERGDVRFCETTAAGIPFVALTGSESGTMHAGYCDVMVQPDGLWYARESRLPLRPYLPGFVLDTLFYAAPWWLVLITPGTLKRWRRRRRGRCIHCGYDLTGLRHEDNATPACPECGA